MLYNMREYEVLLNNFSSMRLTDPRLRNMRNEMRPIDFSELTAESMDMMASTRKFLDFHSLIPIQN